jgi:hypothetical protein
VGRRIAVWSLSLAVCIGPLPAAAQLAPGEILVTVTDAATKAPIADAVVFLLGGDKPESSLTDPDGKLTFQQVQVGSYVLEVQKDGYKKLDVADVEVRENKHVAVAVALEGTTSLKTIATVVAKASSSITTTEIGEDSAQRRVSTSLKDALGKIAGVTIDDTTYGPNSSFGISLRNQEESQTNYAVNGIRIGGPGGGALASSGLFGSASVDLGTSGGIRNTLNFQTARPSKYWTYDVTNEIGNFGASTESQSITGTNGRLGMAFQHAVTRRDSNLSGLFYEDQSGLAYLHDAANSGNGEILRLNYAVNPRVSFGVFDYGISSRYSTICSTFTTLLPCGFGPGGENTNTSGLVNVSAKALLGSVQLTATASSNHGRYEYANATRTFAGVVTPYVSQSSYSTFYGSLYAEATSRRHTIDFGAYGGSIETVSSTTYSGVPVSFPQPRERTLTASLSDRVEADARLTLSHAVYYSSDNLSGHAFLADESAVWTPGKNDTIQASVLLGGSQPSFFASDTISDPLSAQYDCGNRSIFVSGPADRPGPQSTTNYDLSWRHNLHGGNLNVSLYRKTARGQYLSLAVPIAAEPGTLFPGGLPGYLASLQAVWNTPGVCGAQPFTTDRIYVTDTIAGLGEMTTGADVSASIPIGTNVMIFPTYSLGAAYLTTLDARLAAPGSYYAIGTQLPYRPLRTAGLTMAGVLAHSGLDWGVSAQYTDANNGNNLPAYTIYGAGISFKAHPGTMTLAESNIFGAHAGLFATYQGVNPMPLIGGGTFALSTRPVSPRQWIFTWRIPWSQRIPPPPKPSSKP